MTNKKIDHTFFRRAWNEKEGFFGYLVKPSRLASVITMSKPADDYHGGGYCRACGEPMGAAVGTVHKFIFTWTPEDNDCPGFMHTDCVPVLNAEVMESISL
jgi:hypothetical protein